MTSCKTVVQNIMSGNMRDNEKNGPDLGRSLTSMDWLTRYVKVFRHKLIFVNAQDLNVYQQFFKLLY